MSSNHANNLRHRLGNGESVLMPGVWDPLSALLSRDAGFNTVFMSGFCVSATLLGEPDIGLVTQIEMADVARRVCAAVPDVNVIVDADTGYGNPSNVIRTVELCQLAGAAGIFLEDQMWPKKCGHMDGKQVVPRQEWLAKLRAAVDHGESLHITARTDARGVEGLDEAIERAKMARDTGVDALFIEAPQSVAELEAIAAALTDISLVANMVETGKTPLLTPAELSALGFNLIVSPLTSLFSMARAISQSLQILATEGTLRGHLDRLLPFDEFTAVVGLDKHLSNEADYR